MHNINISAPSFPFKLMQLDTILLYILVSKAKQSYTVNLKGYSFHFNKSTFLRIRFISVFAELFRSLI